MTAFGGVYYQNALGSVGLLALCIVTNEFHDVDVTSWNAMVWGPLLTSCLLGMGLSTFAYRVRAMTSATAFAILGNVCKVKRGERGCWEGARRTGLIVDWGMSHCDGPV